MTARNRVLTTAGLLAAAAAIVAISLGFSQDSTQQAAIPENTSLAGETPENGPNTAEQLPEETGPAGPVDTFGDPLPPLMQGETDQAIGMQAPQALALDYSDGVRTVAGERRAQVLVFLAHWCPACEQELPTLRALHDGDLIPDSLDMILVTTGYDQTRPNWPPDLWLAEAGLADVPTIRDDIESTLMSLYGLSAYPAWLALDSEGRVVLRAHGILDETAALAVLDLVDSHEEAIADQG